jgi:hypothetical protein
MGPAGERAEARQVLVRSGPSAVRAVAALGPSVTGRFCAQHESARNAGETPGCGTADGAARRTRGTQTGSPPVPAGRGCRRPACGALAEWEAAAARAAPVRTPNAGTRARTHRTGSLAPRPALCRAAAARAAGCSMRSCIHGRTAVPPVGTPKCIESRLSRPARNPGQDDRPDQGRGVPGRRHPAPAHRPGRRPEDDSPTG